MVLKQKIDLILTKSVARFARNTVDSLKYVRKLKAKGIGIFFEEQNINTLNIDSEMFIGFYSVLAQAESENISANVRWGIQQRMKAGTYAFRYNILGYKKGANGEPEIVEKEAEIIRKIYQMYLDGKSVDQIKEYLESNHYSTTRGKEIWSKSVILRILTNERYCGEMLLQKTYTENCISKKKKINHGEMAKYLIKNSHKPIIDKSIFKAVQLEIAKRCTKKKTIMNGLTKKSKYSGKYALTDLLVCGECGSCYRRKSWTRNNKKKIVWRCLNRIKYGAKICKHSISIEDEELKQIIIRSINKVIDEKEEIVSMITNNLSYEISKDDCFLNVYAIENQINELNKLRDDTISMRINTKGDKKRYDEEIKNLTLQIVSLRDELEIEREKSKEKKERCVLWTAKQRYLSSMMRKIYASWFGSILRKKALKR